MHLQGLNEIQAYILVNRWALKHNNSVPEVSQQLLQQLQQTYLLQRSCLLRSIQHLLLELDLSAEPHQSLTALAITDALKNGLDTNLCEFLAISLDPECHQSLALKGSSPAFAPNDITAATPNDQDAERQSWLCQQQALMEQECVMELVTSVFEQRVCSTTCFSKVMNAIHLHTFSSWHEAIAAGGTKARVARLVSDRSAPSCLLYLTMNWQLYSACLLQQVPSHCVGLTCNTHLVMGTSHSLVLQAQVLSLHLLNLPVLLEHLRLGTPPAAEEAPLLASSQDVLCQTFLSWAGNSDSNPPSSASLTSGHAPALLAFAAIATLSRDIPNFSGQQSHV